MKSYTFTLIALILLIGISSCKKDEVKIIPESKCKITSIAYEYGAFYNLTYDGELVTNFKNTKYEYKLFYYAI